MTTPRRFYVAYALGYPQAVLRFKDAAGLAEWRARSWTMFAGASPIICEVTSTTLAMCEERRQMTPGERARSYPLLVVTEDGPAIINWRIDSGRSRRALGMFFDLRARLDDNVFPGENLGPWAAS